ncbi:MAG TPA: BatD protein [Bacteroidales bacterium]|nr:BatD protein [Bacteroidales bacterium]
MNRLLHILSLLLVLFSSHLIAQDVSFTMKAPDRVSQGQRFNIVFVVNAEIDEFRAPTFDGFQLLSGPNQAQSSSISFVNGKVSQNINISYSYILAAPTVGSFTIGAAKCKIDGKDYTTKAQSIEVVAGSSAGTNTSSTATASESVTLENVGDDQLFIEAFVNKKKVFQGEQILLTNKIFTLVPVSNLSVDKLSAYPGFWSVNLMDNSEQLKQYNQTVNGKEYIVADLKREALFAQKTGRLEIAPMELSCVAKIPNSKKKTNSNDPFFDSFFNDPFFNNAYQSIEKKLVTKKINIDVVPLPSQGKPLDFSGAVGEYSISSSIDRLSLKTNEAVVVKYSVSGDGNLELISNLQLKFPADFEVYDPKVTTNTNNTNNGVSGYKIFEYTLIPRSAGNYTIPSVNFNYFNPKTQKYETKSTDSYELQIEKGAASANSNISFGNENKEDIRYLGQDIRYIVKYPYKLQLANSRFFGSFGFYFFLFLPLLLLVLIVVVWRKEIKKRSNQGLMKNKLATKLAKRRLKKASEFLKTGNDQEFYVEMSQALWGYIADKFNIPLSSLSVDTVQDYLSDKNVNVELIQEFTQTLNDCEYARFAPGNKNVVMDKVYREGLLIISKIENQLK